MHTTPSTPEATSAAPGSPRRRATGWFSAAAVTLVIGLAAAGCGSSSAAKDNGGGGSTVSSTRPPAPTPAPTPVPSPSPKPTPAPRGSVPPALVHTYSQEHWTLDEAKQLTITADGSYSYVDTAPGQRYTESGVVVADGSTITFHSSGPAQPVIGLALGQPGHYQLTQDEIGSPILLLQVPGHQNFDGASNTADLFYF